MRIGGLDVGRGHPCAFVAEIGNAHNRDLSRAIRLLDAAKKSGASAAKLQCYTVAELLALRGDGPAPSPWGDSGWSMRDLYSKAITPAAWFPVLFRHAASIDLPIFSSVFGLESLALLESIGNLCYKMARLDIEHAWLAGAIRATGKPLIISQYNEPLPSCDAVLYAPPGYPQEPSSFDFTSDLFTEYDGFSYHGASLAPPIAAAQLGAKIIEAHFQLDDEPSELEAAVSVNASDFRRMVATVREYEAVTA